MSKTVGSMKEKSTREGKKFYNLEINLPFCPKMELYVSKNDLKNSPEAKDSAPDFLFLTHKIKWERFGERLRKKAQNIFRVKSLPRCTRKASSISHSSRIETNRDALTYRIRNQWKGNRPRKIFLTKALLYAGKLRE